MRKICVITGTRAEYGLLYWIIKGLNGDKEVDLQICVTGMHLSPEFGFTYQEIEKDGFIIDKKIEMLLSSDTPIGIAKSMGLAMICFGEYFAESAPDLVVVVGDRFEIFAAVSAAMVTRIPVAHCHGGEATEGLIDEPIRHSITKMSHLHFTSTQEYRKRVIQLGESPDRVFNVGALGIENINRLTLLNREEFQCSIGFKLGANNLLVAFHPVTLESASAQQQFNELLKALSYFRDFKIIFTKTNADTDGRIINKMIDDFCSKNSERAISFTSLGQIKFLSALKHIDILIGNSSSGIIEAPSFKKVTINIGDRQRGRIKASSVIDCEPKMDLIIHAIKESLTLDFQTKLEYIENPYGKGNPSELILPILKKFPLEGILKKKFYDLV